MKVKDYIGQKIAALERDRDYHVTRQASVGPDKLSAKAERDEIQNVLDTKLVGLKARDVLESRMRELDARTNDLNGEDANVDNRIGALNSIIEQLRELWELLP